MTSESSTIKCPSFPGAGSVQDRVSNQQCLRCGGLLVIDHCLDLLNVAGQIDVEVMRCVLCGDIVDSVILRHRNMQRRGIVNAKPVKGDQGCTQASAAMGAEVGQRREARAY